MWLWRFVVAKNEAPKKGSQQPRIWQENNQDLFEMNVLVAPVSF